MRRDCDIRKSGFREDSFDALCICKGEWPGRIRRCRLRRGRETLRFRKRNREPRILFHRAPARKDDATVRFERTTQIRNAVTGTLKNITPIARTRDRGSPLKACRDASARTSSTPSTPARAMLLRAASKMTRETSSPTTRPGRTAFASSIVVRAVPQPTCSTCSPGCGAAVRKSAPVNGMKRVVVRSANFVQRAPPSLFQYSDLVATHHRGNVHCCDVRIPAYRDGRGGRHA